MLTPDMLFGAWMEHLDIDGLPPRARSCCRVGPTGVTWRTCLVHTLHGSHFASLMQPAPAPNRRFCKAVSWPHVFRQRSFFCHCDICHRELCPNPIPF